MHMSTAALFRGSKRWKQSQCVLEMDMCTECGLSVKYCLATGKNAVLRLAATWVSLENVLCDRTHMQKTTCCVIVLM